MKVTTKISPPKTTYYKVVAKTYEEAVDFFDNRGAAGQYEANTKINYKYNSAGNTNLITLSAKPTISMPKWKEASKLKGPEKKKWEAMLKALAKHEQKHHALFEADVKKFKKDIEAAGDFPKGETAKILNSFVTLSQTNQVNFDRKSDHGKKEGVRLL